ncbi:hypothetical protein HK096_010242, partial [Nowakowskiella sp. JEL0078]
YNFGNKIMGITCDNASNNDKFIEILLERNEHFFDFNHFRCFAHVINLAVQEAYYNVTSEACTVATVLDPRLRLDYYKSYENEDNQVDSQEIFDIVNAKYLADYAPANVATNASATSVVTKQTIANRIFKKQKVEAESELKEYCNGAPLDSDTKPLDWWKANKVTYPNLAHMAKDYLAIP